MPASREWGAREGAACRPAGKIGREGGGSVLASRDNRGDRQGQRAG